MAAVIVSKNGTTTIDNEVIARIAGLAATDCYGVVGMCAKSVKDGVFRLLKLETLTRGVKIDIEDNLLSIKLHIMVEYGTNIPAITDSLISNVRYKIEESVGLVVSVVEVYVENIRVNP